MAFAITGFPVAVVPVWDVDLTPNGVVSDRGEAERGSNEKGNKSNGK